MSVRGPPLETDREIRLSPNGFSLLRDGQVEFEINWDNVRGISAYKEDLFTIDQICLAFRTEGDLGYPWVTEHDAGYDDLVAEIERRFPDRDPEWWSKAAFPPFQFR